MRRALLVVAALFGGATAAQAQTLPCTYAGPADIVTVADCGWIDADGTAHIRPERLARLTYDSGGFSAVRLGQWYLVRRDGRMAPAMIFDNWAEDFADGLVRSPRGGKIGFIDRNLVLVIPARFDGAYRFRGGRAVVCIGCRPASDGEHNWYAGGLWGCITREGRELAALRPLAEGENAAGLCQSL